MSESGSWLCVLQPAQINRFASCRGRVVRAWPHSDAGTTTVRRPDARSSPTADAWKLVLTGIRGNPKGVDFFVRPVFHVRDFFGAESHDHQRAIYCHFHEHLNHAKVYHVIQVVRVSTPVNFHSSETSTRVHMVENNEYNNTPFQQEKWNDLGQTNDIQTNNKLMIIFIY